MKKQNNRFRNGNNNNNCYTLNYKFDSVSIAGKISGTALDLIRRYNDLAKEAQSCGNYVEMEIFRQYAEHYRKIVTEINERRQARQENAMPRPEGTDGAAEGQALEEASAEQPEAKEPASEPAEPVAAPNGYVETLPAAEQAPKSFQVVEITDSEPLEQKEKPKRTVTRRRVSVAKKATEA